MTTLADYLGGKDRILGGPFGSKLTQADYATAGVPVIRGGNMEHNGRWVGGEFVFVSEAKVESDLRSNLALPGHIVVTQRGTLGQVSIIPSDSAHGRYVISQSQMAIAVPGASANPLFVYYYLKSEVFESYVERTTIQTGVPHINLGILRDAPVDWPERPQQDAIASILGALDDKIELNRRMNETLEAMARAIFKDWFVDFGPTRAKIVGRKPYLAPDLWSHFPARLDADGKPEGWEMLPLIDVCQLKRGYDLPSQSRVSGPVPIVSSSGPSGWHNEKMVAPPGIVTGRYGTIGQVFTCHRDFWPLKTTLYVRDFKRHPFWFVYHTLTGLDFTKYSDKAAVPGVNRNALHLEQVIVPDGGMLRAFDEMVAPWMDMTRANTAEMETLAGLRDLLLPKLMSGELRVKDAEKMVGATT
jgi:type I restriction enzyme, S subunit